MYSPECVRCALSSHILLLNVQFVWEKKGIVIVIVFAFMRQAPGLRKMN